MRLQIIRLYCNNSNQKQNNNKCQGECKSIICAGKIIFGILACEFMRLVHSQI